MFNRDHLFGKKDEEPRNDLRGVNVTPTLNSAQNMRTQAEPTKVDPRFAEPPKPAARVDEPSGSRLIVGPDIKLKGVEISNCDTLVVEGRVEASMDSRVVQIAENGVFSGTVSIDVAEIRGRFEGELTARKRLVIYSTGRVSGRIRYGKIYIEEGGELSGEVSNLAVVAAPAQQPIQPQPQTQPQVQPPAQAQQPAQPQPSVQPPQQQTHSPKQSMQPAVAAASSAEKPRYETLTRGGKQSGKTGANAG